MAVNLKKGSVVAALSITPLIDIVFLLLIFFLVATKFSEKDRAMNVSLPAASEAKPLFVKPAEMFINIDRDGNYFYKQEQLTDERLFKKLDEAVTNNPNQPVVIRADKDCVWDRVANAMNLCNKAGTTNYRVNVAPDEG